MKVAIIGAGSLVFCKTLMLDTMQIPGIGHVEFTLMAPSTRNTSCVKRFADQIIAKYKIDAEVNLTTSREEALDGADYVIATLRSGPESSNTMLKSTQVRVDQSWRPLALRTSVRCYDS